jgi:predicted nucleic acid-binding protein
LSHASLLKKAWAARSLDRSQSSQVDLMIAATAMAAELPLYTTNPDDFAGLGHLVTVIPVTRPDVPNERQPGR